jgi:hypothetical protein
MTQEEMNELYYAYRRNGNILYDMADLDKSIRLMEILSFDNKLIRVTLYNGEVFAICEVKK